MNTFSTGALIVIDGIHKYERIGLVEDLINVDDIYKIKVTQGPAAALKYSGQHMSGLIEITTKGNQEYFDSMKIEERPDPGLNMLSWYMVKRQFYAPDYELLSEDEIPELDQRSTIYWNPEIQTDENGMATVTFFNSDMKGPVSIVIEGTCNEGLLGTARYQYTVRRDSIPIYLK